jgi:hypothetical protein
LRLDLLAACCLPLFLLAPPAHADGLRPAIAKPLQLAEHDIAIKNYAAAQKQLAKADAVPGKTAGENLAIAQVHAAIDAAQQNYPAASADYAALIATGQLPAAQVTLMAQAEASMDYQAGNYAGTIATVKKYLPHDARFTPLLLQSYLKTNDCPSLQAAVQSLPKPPPETDLQMVAYCDATTKDQSGYQAAIARLVADYPTPAYWTELLGMEQANPDFSNNLALDFFRLKLATGVPAAAADYVNMTEAALESGLPNEAAIIINHGFSAGILGAGADADRQARLKTLVAKRLAAAQNTAAQQLQTATAAQDQPTLFTIGLNDADAGNPAGIPLMVAAIRSGKLTQPGQAELELGLAYHELNQQPNAKAMWAAVQGGGAPVELAKLWLDVR